MRARSTKKKSGFSLPKFSFVSKGFWMPAGGLVAVTAAVVLMFLSPHNAVQTGDAPDVTTFIQTLGQQASAEEQELQETDAVIAMLDNAAQTPPQQVNPDGNATSDEMMKTLFDDGNGQDDDSWLQKL